MARHAHTKNTHVSAAETEPGFALYQGTNGDDALIVGTDGNDVIRTGSGNDLIIAGLGADTGFFDWEVQTWKLLSAADSPIRAGDTLINFNYGGVLDKIDLTAFGITLDDITVSGADQNWQIEIDTNGDFVADMGIGIVGAQPVDDNFMV
jgi:Ca2+-binding RTX toxin-like protein